jgi:hypothetical protein
MYLVLNLYFYLSTHFKNGIQCKGSMDLWFDCKIVIVDGASQVGIFGAGAGEAGFLDKPCGRE